jgi:hypothetical protein
VIRIAIMAMGRLRDGDHDRLPSGESAVMKIAPCISKSSPERPDSGRKSAAYEG